MEDCVKKGVSLLLHFWWDKNR